MKSSSAILILVSTCAGCSLTSEPARDSSEPARVSSEPARVSLDEADRLLAATNYARARDAYAAFVDAHPDSPQSARARATQAALDRLLRIEAELDSVKRTNEAPRLSRELSERQNEVDRLRAEVAKLRADLERLRSIDLQALPAGKK